MSTVRVPPVLRQEAISVAPVDTLEERIHAVEHRLLPEVVRSLLTDPAFATTTAKEIS